MNSGGLRQKGTGKFSRLSTPFLDSLWGMGKKSTAVTMVTTPRLGEASFAGGNGEVVRQVSAWGTKFGPERKNSMLRCVVRLLYGSGTRLVTQLNEEMSTATRRSSPRRRAVHHARRRDEDDPLSVLIR
jgi:hypothetical protein